MTETSAAPLVSADWLAAHLNDPKLRLLDCRFDLRDALSGQFAYLEGHIPGAVYANLESDLSGPVTPSGAGGRHPLPDPAELAAWLGRVGIGADARVVCYDDPRGGNGMFAARAWWLLRWLGQRAVSVLDGGWPAWLAVGGPVSAETPTPTPVHFEARPQSDWLASADEVARRGADTVLLDARVPERFRGDVEPLDRRAGHIPGALNAGWAAALDEAGHWQAPQAQQARLAALEGHDAIVYCGSGVSAAANLLALALTGREPGPHTRLYAGSWSDWVSDERRPMATGED